MQRGLAALRAGDATVAAELFEQQLAQGDENAALWLALAFARARLEQPEATLDAVDRALDLDPRDLRALLFKADHLERMGRSRVAFTFYQGALRVAAGAAEIPQDVQQGLHRAQQYCDRQADNYEAYLQAALAERGYQHDANSRFSEALDIALGAKPVQMQQPTRFYFPGLPQKAFYEREHFPWLEELESHTEQIREELLALLQQEDCFSPYLQVSSDVPQLNDRSNVGNLDWSAFFLWQDGEVVTDNAERCPRTMAALEQVPAPHVAGQTPCALFSKLAPGASIPPHHGVLNTRLICHLPLIVPENCGALRVGNYQREWREGEAFVFDDSVEHEAWNHSAQPRVVLLFDVWRPELTEEERHWVSQMLLAVDAYGAQ